MNQVRIFRDYIFVVVLLLAVAVSAVGCATATPNPTSAPPTAAVSTNAPAPTGAPALTDAPAPTTAPAPTDALAPTTAPAPSGATNAAGAAVALNLVPGKSKAGYRVREQLAGVSLPGDAVGTTDAITGAIVGKTDGTLVSAESKFVVDLRTLQSDQRMRDGFIQRETLRTSQYPTATFVPTAVSGFPTILPPTGQVSFQLTGDLTIRDVTRPTTWDVTCQPTSQTEGTCHATTTFTFGDFQLEQPRVPRVLSIEDKIILEVDVTLQVAQP